MRLFFALPVAEALRPNLLALQDEIRQTSCGDKFCYVEPENFHITLAFLGEFATSSPDAPDQRLVATLDVGRRVAIYSTAARLEACGVGGFGGKDQEVGAIVVAVRGSVPLEVAVQHELGMTLRASHDVVGMATGHYGHITIARGMPAATWESIQHVLGPRRLGSWTADYFDLVESKAASKHEYVTVKRFSMLGDV